MGGKERIREIKGGSRDRTTKCNTQSLISSWMVSYKWHCWENWGNFKMDCILHNYIMPLLSYLNMVIMLSLGRLIPLFSGGRCWHTQAHSTTYALLFMFSISCPWTCCILYTEHPSLFFAKLTPPPRQKWESFPDLCELNLVALCVLMTWGSHSNQSFTI